MSDALILARQFREALLRQDAEAQAKVLRAYEKVWVRLAAEIKRLVEQIAEGETPGLLFQQHRLQVLQDQLALEIDRLATFAGNLTIAKQSIFVKAARIQATRLIRAAGVGARVSLARLPLEELQHLIGVAQDGSPVGDLFSSLGRALKLQARDAVKDAVFEGMAMGSSPRRIAAEIRQQVDNPEHAQQDPRIVRRLNTAIRQETMGAYREATRLSYADNQNLLDGWVWTAVRSATTCVICWAMDGTVHRADERMVSHVNCRCVMRPLLPGQSPGQTGAHAFAQLEAGVQRSILGESAFAAYESKMLELEDFVGLRTDHRWGDSRYRRSLEDILGVGTVRKLRSRR